MRTILIPVFDSFVARNILRTDVAKVLCQNDCRLVIIPPKGKADYYQGQYASKNVIIARGDFWQHTRLEFMLTGLFLHSIPTNFMRIRQVDWYWNKGKYVHYLGVSILRFLGRFRWWQVFLRTVVNNVEPIPAYLVSVMDTYKPDIVFAPTMISREEIALLRIAKRRGIRTVGMFKSWDNPTSKAFMRIFPDTVICHTKFVKNEAIALYQCPAENLVVTGVPQYDRYLEPSFLEEKKDFYEKLGLDPKKKLITYAPAGDWMSDTDKDVVEILLEAIASGSIPLAQVLLRLHPAYESRTIELVGHPNLVIERPGIYLTENIKEVEVDEKEARHLATTMAYSDVTINTASTLTIESAIFGTPIVLVGFDAYQQRSYWQSVSRYYDREHYRYIIKTNGAALAKNSKEFIQSLSAYLQEPGKDKEGRSRIVQEQCGMMDGMAGERVAFAILGTR